ncbi:aminotransferase class IV [Mangrovimonas sp. ST2L15]|uniref:aminotransferase class IV n=1 Tax=Mangrovimonas sp. ST2L15 TaxID=1645916 RepID=UPI0006B69B06|nr:aminotransferase class IV [Mangrovimonas sp. ST2L15]
MINFNGTLTSTEQLISAENRGYNYGDMVFETMKYVSGKLFFWEDHYFRLMASMRILRMDIPMEFTMEFLQEEIVKTIQANNLEKKSVRIKLAVNRVEGGLYTPNSNRVSYLISVKGLESDFYLLNEYNYQVDLFKDFYVAPGLFSTLKTNNRALNVVGSIYAQENDLQNCLLLNTEKQVIEALNGNVFLVKGKTVKTPPLQDGCLKGIMRKQIMEIIELMPDWEIKEESISPFELQKADELFITNVITGIQPVTKYRKKNFSVEFAKEILQKVNVKVRLS